MSGARSKWSKSYQQSSPSWWKPLPKTSSWVKNGNSSLDKVDGKTWRDHHGRICWIFRLEKNIFYWWSMLRSFCHRFRPTLPWSSQIKKWINSNRGWALWLRFCNNAGDKWGRTSDQDSKQWIHRRESHSWVFHHQYWRYAWKGDKRAIQINSAQGGSNRKIEIFFPLFLWSRLWQEDPWVGYQDQRGWDKGYRKHQKVQEDWCTDDRRAQYNSWRPLYCQAYQFVSGIGLKTSEKLKIWWQKNPQNYLTFEIY